MCNMIECDKKANCQDMQLCNICKVYLTFDKFRKKQNGSTYLNCIDCNQKRTIYANKKCDHGIAKSTCKDCNNNFCEHKIQRSQCKECGGYSICEHKRQRSACKECSGGSICEHKRKRSSCKECGGGSVCEHKRLRSVCKDCGGGSICKHGQRRTRCKECDFGGYLRDIVSSRCRHSLKSNKSESSIEYLGCNITTFKKHIEAQFHPGMSWDNYGEWEIDHIIPIKYKKPSLDQQIARLHYTNTQPLWKDQNISKGNKLIYGVLYNHDFHTEFKDCQ